MMDPDHDGHSIQRSEAVPIKRAMVCLSSRHRNTPEIGVLDRRVFAEAALERKVKRRRCQARWACSSFRISRSIPALPARNIILFCRTWMLSGCSTEAKSASISIMEDLADPCHHPRGGSCCGTSSRPSPAGRLPQLLHWMVADIAQKIAAQSGPAAHRAES